MTDQLTRIERMLSKALEDIEELKSEVSAHKKNVEEQLYDIQEELGQLGKTEK